MQSYAALKKNILSNKQVREYYKDFGPEYSLISQVIEARISKGYSQKILAQKIGTKQSAISRFESGNYNPSLAFLTKISKALQVKLHILIE